MPCAAIVVLVAISFNVATPARAQTTRPVASAVQAGVEQQPIETRTVARAAATQPAAQTAASAGLDWQRLVMAMAIVLGLIFLLKGIAGKAFPGLVAARNSRAVRVLSRSPLAPKQQLMLVQVGRRVLVIGDSAGTLTSLSSITDPDEVATLIGQIENAESTTASAVSRPFANLFGRARDAYAEPASDAAGELTGGPFAGRIGRNLAAEQIEESADARIEDRLNGRGGTSPPADGGGDLEEAQTEISSLIQRMRSLTKTMRQ